MLFFRYGVTDYWSNQMYSYIRVRENILFVLLKIEVSFLFGSKAPSQCNDFLFLLKGSNLSVKDHAWAVLMHYGFFVICQSVISYDFDSTVYAKARFFKRCVLGRLVRIWEPRNGFFVYDVIIQDMCTALSNYYYFIFRCYRT